jgi:cell division protein FtsB
MLLEPDIRPDRRKSPRGPEPLRRKRVQPSVPAATPRRRKALNVLLGFAAAVLLLDAFVGEKGLIEGLRARQAYDEAEGALNALRSENARLLEDVRRYREDPAAIESLAREELGFIRPGELLFIVRDVTPAPR